MAGISGKTAWVGAARQTGRGTAAALPAYKNPFSGGSIGPVRETDTLTETDTTRDRGSSFVTTSGVEGAPELYCRPSSIGFYLYAALGADTVTGASAPYTHEITPAQAVPYVTFWRSVGGVLHERFEDCFVGGLTVSADAGQPLTSTVSVQGRRAARLTAEPAGAALSTEPVFSFNEAAVLLGGGATSLVSSFEFSLENNASRQQTDDVVPYDVVVGQREVSLGFNMIFESIDAYNEFHYGGAAGTAISPNIYTTSARFTFTKDADTELVFDFPSIAYEEFPVEPDPGGDPITVAVRAVAQRSGSPVVTATVKNTVASYAA